MDSEQYGWDQARFVQVGDQFECLICSMIVRNPQECSGCGHLFCKKCIDDWLRKNSRECPNRCALTTNQINGISKALQRMYNNLDIRCNNFSNCKQTLKLVDIEKHESDCCSAKCPNHALCGKKASQEFGSSSLCSLECQALISISKTAKQEDWYKILLEFGKKLEQRGSALRPAIHQKSDLAIQPSLIQNVQQNASWRWDSKASGTGIKINDSGFNCFLQESSYMFRTIIGDTPMMKGCHYWQIIADPKTENELKIGVAIKKDFNYNSAFCDFEYGFAFYGLGQLRHGSNAAGTQYGKRFKKEGVLGIYLNMNKGSLSFALNGEFFGVAFTDSKLANGPIYPAVSLLHQAGCTIKSGLPVPNYFVNC